MRRSILLLTAMMVTLATAAAARAEVPETLSHDGFLADAQGNPVTASLPFSFKIYTVETGGDPVWLEIIPSLSVSGGFYAATLGLSTPLKDVFNAKKDVWLEISVDGDAISPRQKLGAVPYALVAGDAVGDIHPTSITVNGTKVIDSDGKWAGDPAGIPGVKSVAASAPLTGGTITDTGRSGS